MSIIIDGSYSWFTGKRSAIGKRDDCSFPWFYFFSERLLCVGCYVIIIFSLYDKDNMGYVKYILMYSGFMERVPLIEKFGKLDVFAYEFVEHLSKVFLINILILHDVAVELSMIHFVLVLCCIRTSL